MYALGTFLNMIQVTNSPHVLLLNNHFEILYYQIIMFFKKKNGKLCMCVSEVEWFDL